MVEQEDAEDEVQFLNNKDRDLPVAHEVHVVHEAEPMVHFFYSCLA